MGERILDIFEVKTPFFSAMYGHILRISMTVQEVPLEPPLSYSSKRVIQIVLERVQFHSQAHYVGYHDQLIQPHVVIQD